MRLQSLGGSVIPLHELEHGVLLAERADSVKGAVLRTWLDHSVVAAFEGRVLPVDEAVARRAAAFHVPAPAPFRDALVGAPALVNRMTVGARDLKNFRRFLDVNVLNPGRDHLGSLV